MILRQAFGGANSLYECPAIITEKVIDLWNGLLNYLDWDETKLFSPNVENLSEPILLHDSVPYGLSLSLDVEFSHSTNGKMDDCIDNITASGYYNHQWKGLTGTALLSLHIWGGEA